MMLNYLIWTSKLSNISLVGDEAAQGGFFPKWLDSMRVLSLINYSWTFDYDHNIRNFEYHLYCTRKISENQKHTT